MALFAQACCYYVCNPYHDRRFSKTTYALEDPQRLGSKPRRSAFPFPDRGSIIGNVMKEEYRMTFCRLVGHLLVADIQLHDSEVRFLEGLYARLEISEDERREIERTVNLDDDIVSLARSLPDEVRVELLQELHDAAWADGVLVPSEARVIKVIEDLFG